MDVRNRMADVVKLRCNACQDFLKLVIRQGWQQKLYDKAEKAVIRNEKYKDKYIAAYEKMRDTGIENYGIDVMDVTFISEIILHCGNIVSASDETKRTLRQLVDDRNQTNHSSENEEPEELYLRGLLALCDLRKFIRVVDKTETSIDDNARMQYRKEYMAKIEELKTLLDDERIELIKREKDIMADIKKVLNSDDDGRTWAKINGYYCDKYFKIDKEAEAYQSFIFKAAEAGVMEAYGIAAEYHIERKNYDEAERLLAALHESNAGWDPKDMMRLAEIYLNRRSKNVGDGKKILQELTDAGYSIESKDGKTYTLLSKSVARRGKPLFGISVAEQEEWVY